MGLLSCMHMLFFVLPGAVLTAWAYSLLVHGVEKEVEVVEVLLLQLLMIFLHYA